MAKLEIQPVDKPTNTPLVAYVTKIETADDQDWAKPGMKIFPSERSQPNFVNSVDALPPVCVAGSVTAAGYKPATFGPTLWDGCTDLDITVPLDPFV